MKCLLGHLHYCPHIQIGLFHQCSMQLCGDVGRSQMPVRGPIIFVILNFFLSFYFLAHTLYSLSSHIPLCIAAPHKNVLTWMILVGLGVRVYPKFRVGLFGFFIFRVSNSWTRTRTRTRNFGYPQIRVWVWVKFGYTLLLILNLIQPLYLCVP
jgi:hypothetical protein